MVGCTAGYVGMSSHLLILGEISLRRNGDTGTAAVSENSVRTWVTRRFVNVLLGRMDLGFGCRWARLPEHVY